jgi:hypothetical protein
MCKFSRSLLIAHELSFNYQEKLNNSAFSAFRSCLVFRFFPHGSRAGGQLYESEK